MGERTEEQKVVQAPIVVVLGGKKYDVAPLVIRDCRPWRVKVVAALADLPKHAQITTDNPEAFGQALNAMLVGMPDTVLDLFFDYARNLDRDEIEASATDKEVAEAFRQVVDMAFPLAGSLVGTMGKLAQ